jgi:hypothetical protein
MLCGAAVCPLAAGAQLVRRIGILSGFAEDPMVESELLRPLSQLNGDNGRNVQIDLRWGAGDIDRIRMMAKELVASLDSGYSVGTAGTKAAGRSRTLQLFHGSEVAFWPNAASHFAGVLQAVPDLPETEIILESTANGIGGEFHERWQMAEAGIGDYQAIFVPWFWSEEYARPVDADFILDDDEEEYAALHGLSMEQMAWRRAKIHELKDPMLFRQEYPSTAAEAFQLTGTTRSSSPTWCWRPGRRNATASGRWSSGPTRRGLATIGSRWHGDEAARSARSRAG